jgi:peptide/nickel transport system permease protein
MIVIGRWLPVAVMVAWALTALFGDSLCAGADQVNLEYILDGPGATGLLGFDDLGRPVLQRLLAGARSSFTISVGVVAISLLLGTSIGLLAAYQRGWMDLLIVRIIDIFMAFPGILLAIALSGVMGPGLDNLIIALTLVGWVGYARLARGQVLSLRERDHVIAAVALGSSRWYILTRHLLPLLAAPLIVESTFGIAGMVIAEAGLSFLGLGIQPPQASWGSMIRDGSAYMLMAPHLVLAPGLAMLLVVLSLNLLGDRLRDWLDIRSVTARKRS